MSTWLGRNLLDCSPRWTGLSYNEYSAFSLLTPPVPAVYISSFPLSPIPLSLFTNMSHPLLLHAFGTLYLFPFHSASTSSYHTCHLCSSYSAGFMRSKTPLPPNHWKHSVSPASHPWSSLPLHTHFLCVSPPFTLPSSTSPSDLSSLSSAQFLSSWAHSVVGVRVDWPESASWAPSSFIRSATFPRSFVFGLLSAASHPFICGAALRVSSPENIYQLTEFALTCL